MPHTAVTVPARLAAFGAALLVAGLLGAGLGAAVGPIEVGGSHDDAPSSTTSPPTAPADPQPTPSHDDPGGSHG